MYDRKTWVIVTLCALLLGANLYYQQKAHQAEADYLTKAQAAEKSAQPAANTTDPAAAPESGLSVDPQPPATEEELVFLENKEIVFTFTNIGGGIKSALFKNQFQVHSKTDHVIANSRGTGPIGAFTDGMGEKLENVVYSYKEEQSVPGKSVVYIAQLPSGLIVKKTFSLGDLGRPGGHYLLDFTLEVQNTAPNAVNLNQWAIFLGEASPLYQKEMIDQTGFFWREDGNMNFEHPGKFKGGMFGSAKSVLTSKAGDKIQFAGVANQFFTTVIRPKEAVASLVWGRESEINLAPGAPPLHSVRAGLGLPAASLEAGQDPKSFSYQIFIGPKDNTMLRKMSRIEEGWGDVMQYGFFSSFVARPLNAVLNKLHYVISMVTTPWAWGLSIIFLTIIVRACIWPLAAKSTRTMKRMSKLQPEMAKLKEKYPDDPNKLNTEMMGLYRKYGINPLGGCLPMVIQIPVFLGFFAMLKYAVELRGQGFLWVTDLSQPDTYHTFHLPFALPFIGSELPLNFLPIVMGLTSFAQIAMTPKTGDKMQQRIVLFMPLIFFFFCYNYASALALYWATQNIFSICQTLIMNKIPEPELKARDTKGKTWVQRMAERQAEAQKNRQAGNMRDVTPEKKKPRSPRTGG